MKKIILSSALALTFLTGCSTMVSPQMTFDASNVDFSKEYKVGSKCMLSIPLISPLINVFLGSPFDIRSVAIDNNIKTVKYFEVERKTFTYCVNVYGE